MSVYLSMSRMTDIETELRAKSEKELIECVEFLTGLYLPQTSFAGAFFLFVFDQGRWGIEKIHKHDADAPSENRRIVYEVWFGLQIHDIEEPDFERAVMLAFILHHLSYRWSIETRAPIKTFGL